MNLRDLTDAQLRQVMEDIWQEAARRERAAPPMESPLGQWEVPVGGVDTDLDGGSGPLRGREWGPSKPSQWPTVPLKQRMLVTS